jgi:16S rRNA (cytidine1402-2'-O)-methyltransferase
MSSVAGALILVGTPIGNLGDLAPRAVEALRAADVIACEDTRHSRKLLTASGIDGRLISVHGHNERSKTTELVESMLAGTRLAFITDAGMPGISDPGERLVEAALAAGVPVEVVPGPSAVIAALVVSGLPTDRFVFEGFLPRKGKDRTTRLAEIAAERRTAVLYEAPHRLDSLIDDLAEVCEATRRVVIARELTKKFEEVWRGTLEDAVVRVVDIEARGEHVVVLEGARGRQASADDVRTALEDLHAAGVDRREAVAEVTSDLGVAKRQVYDVALEVWRAQ